jgi:hypothetical protein
VGVVKVQGVGNCKEKPVRPLMILTLLKGLLCLYLAPYHSTKMDEISGGRTKLLEEVFTLYSSYYRDGKMGREGGKLEMHTKF